MLRAPPVYTDLNAHGLGKTIKPEVLKQLHSTSKVRLSGKGGRKMSSEGAALQASQEVGALEL